MPDWYIKDRIHDGLRVPAHVWMAGLTGLTTAVPPSESATITAPTLIIWGERDELLPPQDRDLLAAAILGSRLIVYEDTGHLVLWEQPERVATDLASFIAGLSTSVQKQANQQPAGRCSPPSRAASPPPSWLPGTAQRRRAAKTSV